MIMARLYYAGNGVEQDMAQYQYWLQLAADNGDKSAKSLLKKYAKKNRDMG
jgi:TPR repeat protein